MLSFSPRLRVSASPRLFFRFAIDMQCLTVISCTRLDHVPYAVSVYVLIWSHVGHLSIDVA
ncbi:MAG: hypothetical protein AUG51_00315 [Acidobacteria bacterium 13_1_20CM_3_53_8]|nr:MAG: hypothetical protein AUG51_00315 [Acidobacteria bacterium 13_1_20CM_3_53_8]